MDPLKNTKSILSVGRKRFRLDEKFPNVFASTKYRASSSGPDYGNASFGNGNTPDVREQFLIVDETARGS